MLIKTKYNTISQNILDQKLQIWENKNTFWANFLFLWPWPWPLIDTLWHIGIFSERQFSVQHMFQRYKHICAYRMTLRYENFSKPIIWHYTDCCYGNGSGTIYSQTCLFINLLQKPCYILRKCTHICPWPHKRWKCHWICSKIVFFQYSETPTHFAEGW